MIRLAMFASILLISAIAPQALGDIALLEENEIRSTIFLNEKDGKVYYRQCAERLPLPSVDRNCRSIAAPLGHPIDHPSYIKNVYKLYKVNNRFTFPDAASEVSQRLEQLSRLDRDSLDYGEAERVKSESVLLTDALEKLRNADREVIAHLKLGSEPISYDLHWDITGHKALHGFTRLFYDDKQYVWRLSHKQVTWDQQARQCRWPWRPAIAQDYFEKLADGSTVRSKLGSLFDGQIYARGEVISETQVDLWADGPNEDDRQYATRVQLGRSYPLGDTYSRATVERYKGNEAYVLCIM